MPSKKLEAKWILYLERNKIFLKCWGKSKWTFREMSKSDLTIFKDNKTVKRKYKNYTNNQMVIHKRAD